MKILFATASPYLPAFAGALKANRLICESFATRHEVRVIAQARVSNRKGSGLAEFLSHLSARGIPSKPDGQATWFRSNGVEVCAVDGPLRLAPALADQIERFAPDCVWVSSDDWRQLLLQAAVTGAPGRVAYLAHAATSLPVGPHSADPRPTEAPLLEQVEAIVAPSRDFARYIERWMAPRRPREIRVIPYPVYGPPPYPRYENAGRGYVTMINPSSLKGIAIFLALARAMPDVAFACVPTWATTEADLAELRSLRNVELLSPREDVDAIYAQTRVLLVPSLWYEVFGIVCVEAMLRGIPVMASDVGGLPEAMLGADFVLPVAPITDLRMSAGLPAPREVPPQDTERWRGVLSRLLEDEALYRAKSADARQRAEAFAASVGVAAYAAVTAQIQARAS